MKSRWWLLAALLPLATGCARIEWHEIIVKKGGCRVVMPGKPTVTRHQIEEMSVKQVFYHDKQRDLGCALYYSDFDEETADGIKGALAVAYEGFIQQINRDLRGKLRSSRTCTIAGHEGRELDMEVSKGSLKGAVFMRVVLIRRRLYWWAIAGTGLKKNSTDVQTFLNSFQLAN